VFGGLAVEFHLGHLRIADCGIVGDGVLGVTALSERAFEVDRETCENEDVGGIVV
jgi:hypothetical protein